MAQAPNTPALMEQTQDPLAQLRDIHMPTAIDTWPPAPGWWFLAALLLIALGAALFWLYRNWRANRYRREALAELESLRSEFGGAPVAYLEHYSALLKRVALTRYSREQVAGLTGESWTLFLDRTGGTQEFTMGAGQALISGAYEKDSNADITSLHRITEHWIRRHGDPVEREAA